MTQIEIEIGLLKKEVVEMWNLVIMQLVKARQALTTFDKDLAREVVLKERRVNGHELKIDRDCENIFALLTPVAVDLRFVLAVLKINSNLERTGDIAEGIAKHIILAEQSFKQEMLSDTNLISMYDEAIKMMEETLSSFENENTELARGIFKKDEYLDGINENANKLIGKYLRIHPEDVDLALNIFSIIRKLERVGDQSKNMAEEIIFYVEAKVLKHRDTH